MVSCMDGDRRTLEQGRADAAARAASAASVLAGLVNDRRDSNSNDDDEHDPEGVTLSSEWDRLTALSDAAAEDVQRFDDAIARWDAGTYGVCTSCGKKIPAARLAARPFAELCVPCAEKAGL
jgi:RNA polymerase-binding transcription factor DksA